MSITRDFKLSLVAGRSVPLVINANQYDDGEIWRFTLLDENGQKYSPSTGSIIGLKSDGHIIANAGTVSSTGLVIIPETEQMTAAVGKNIFELLIDDDTHGTANFIVFVEPRPGAGGTPSDSDLAVFQEAIDAAAQIGDASELVDDVAVLKSRMDEFTTLTDGSTTGDAELADIRVGADGTTYPNAGDAVRGQVSDLKNALNRTEDEIIRTAGVIEELECGLTEEVKTALLACFTRVAWIGDDGQTYYDALSDALNRSRVISGISAVFTQGSAVIYDTDELYALKQYLTVTATYSDGTTKEVNNYTLIGKLVAGTSTITVAYNKKTTTFNVTVTHQTKTLESISATFNSSASITTDNVLDDLRPYLTVLATYADSTTSTITNYSLSGNLNDGTNTITVSYGGKTTTFTVNVTQAEATLQSISAVFNQGSVVIYENSSLESLKPYLTVTARYSNGTTQTVTNYTLSGTLKTGTSTITASYGGKTTTFNVTVTQRATLQSISATFTQGSTVIYTDSSLNDLKPYLTVTANYSDSTTQTVTGYTLSGTLTAGTSVITASYSGKTATFNVTVTERVTPTNPIYTLTTPATFNGTSDFIDTEMQLVDSNKKNITIVGDLLDKSKPRSGNQKMLLHCMHEQSPYPGITIQMNPRSDTEKYFTLNVNSNSASGGYGSIKTTGILNNESEGIREKFVAIIDNQNSTFTLVGVFNGTYFYETNALPSGYSSTEITETAVIGARKKINDGTAQYDQYWKGTIYDLKIYDYSWDKTEADNYVNGGNS